MRPPTDTQAHGHLVLQPDERSLIGMWLRLAKCYNLALREVRASLNDQCTLPQFDVLSQLKRSEVTGLTFSELSRKLLVTAGNLTGIIDRLEQQGLVRRETNPRDRRETFIKLTPKGQDTCAEIIPRHERDLVKIFDGLKPETVELLRTGLAELRKHLDEHGHDEDHH